MIQRVSDGRARLGVDHFLYHLLDRCEEFVARWLRFVFGMGFLVGGAPIIINTHKRIIKAQEVLFMALGGLGWGY